MVFLPRTWLEPHRGLKLISLHARVLQIVLLFLLVGGWAVISDEWVGAAGVRPFATFAFLALMGLLFYVLGRAYGAAESALMHVYVVPTVFFLATVALFFATESGVARLRELLTGAPLWTAPGPGIFLGFLALMVFGFTFFEFGAGKLHPTEVAFILFLMGGTGFVLLYPSLPSFLLPVLSGFVALAVLGLLLGIGYFRRERWLMGFALFFASLLAIVKFLE